jgi:DNA-binding CsgD family transcriptional regulator
MAETEPAGSGRGLVPLPASAVTQPARSRADRRPGRPPRRLSLELRLARRVRAELAGSPDLPAAVLQTETPTLRELEVFLACVELGHAASVADELGIGKQTVKNHLRSLYAKVGAHSKEHAAILLWPVLGEAYVIPGRPSGAPDRRLGRERRGGTR